MKKSLLWLGLMLLGAAAVTLPSCTKLKPVALPFEKEILAFAVADKTNPPPQGAIVFVGSSSVRLWKTLAQDFPDHKVINRGFGGSQMSDVVRYADRIILPHKPKVIVVRVGGNDMSRSSVPEMRSRSIAIDVTRNMTMNGKRPHIGAAMCSNVWGCESKTYRSSVRSPTGTPSSIAIEKNGRDMAVAARGGVAASVSGGGGWVPFCCAI